MTECEFIKECPTLNRGGMENLKGVWMCRYCQGPKMQFCAARKLLLEGRAIPEDLEPGSDLKR